MLLSVHGAPEPRSIRRGRRSMLELPVFVSCRHDDGMRVADWLQARLQGRSLILGDAASPQSAVLSVYIDRVSPLAPYGDIAFQELERAWVWLLICTPGSMHEFPDDRLYREMRWWMSNRSSVAPILITPVSSRWIPEIVLKQWPTPKRVDLNADAGVGLTPAERDFLVDQNVQSVLAAIAETVTESSETGLVLRPSDSLSGSSGVNLPGLYTWQKDKYLRYIDANENYARAAGFDSPKAMLGKTDHDMAWRSLADFFQAGDRQVISGMAPSRINVQETEIMVDRIADILVTERPLLVRGKCVGLSGFFADITGHKLVPRIVESVAPGQGIALGPEFGDEHLSELEVGVLKGMLKSFSSVQIAGANNLPRAAVEDHMQAIRRKLQCATDGDVITVAIRTGLPLALFGPAIVIRSGFSQRSYLTPAQSQPPGLVEASQPEHQTYVLAQATVPELKWYSESKVEGWMHLPECRPLDHTMFEALDEYVRRKIPIGEVKEVITGGGRIEVHGVFPDDFVRVAPALGLGGFEELRIEGAATDKRFNSIRPAFYKGATPGGESRMVVCVTPGRDYVLHYAAMIRHIVVRHTRRAEDLITITRYPVAERELPARTGLTSLLVAPGDRVLVCYVEPIKAYLDKTVWASRERVLETPHFGSYRYRLPGGSALNLLGVRYSFWGSIAEVLVRELCRLDASEILYVAKLGALTSPNEIYERIFCPSQFVILQHAEVAQFVAAPPSGVLELFPDLDSGCHVSVPTVLEEDYTQREVTTKLAARSIDNEISRMANAVSGFNRTEGRSVSFTALYFNGLCSWTTRTKPPGSLRLGHEPLRSGA
jgi:hypothetical protein